MTPLTLVLMLLWLPSVAFADAVVLLPPRGDAELAKEQAEAHRVVANALSAQGLRVVPHTEPQGELTDGPPCVTSDCAPGLIAAAKADFAAVVAVWAGSDGGPGVVFVTLVDPEGARFPGQSKAVGGDLTAAASAALLDARGLQLLGPGPWLRVAGEPDGARVFIDGEYVGAVPYRATVDAGTHRLEVKAQGHEPLERTVDVPANRSRQVNVEVALARVAAEAAPAVVDGGNDAAAQARTAGADGQGGQAILGPVLLGVAGLGLSLYATIDMASAGSCEDSDAQGVCLRERRSQGAGAAYLGVGVGAMAGALLWYLLSDDGSPEQQAGLSLVVSPTDVGVAGRF